MELVSQSFPFVLNMPLLSEGQYHCPVDGSFKEAATQLEVAYSRFKGNSGKVKCTIISLKQSFREMSHLSVLQAY